MADLLEFHRRCEKPQWWEMFSRAELSFDELLESVDAVAGLQRVHGTFDEYEYPPQEIKFEADDYAIWLGHPEAARVRLLEVDEERRRVRLKSTAKSGPLPAALSVGKDGPIQTQVLKDALLRVGQSVVDGDHRYRALEAYFEKKTPKLNGRDSRPADRCEPERATRQTSSPPCRRSTIATCSSRGRPGPARPTPART